MDTEQLCPNCGKVLSLNTRYPGYLCESCVTQLHDGNNNLVVFINEDIGGYGVIGFYQKQHCPYHTNKCFIDGIECRAHAAYMGGIVVQPLTFWDRNLRVEINI